MFTTRHPQPAPRDAFGMALIGTPLAQLRGHRFAADGEVAPTVTPATIAANVQPQFVAPISTTAAPPAGANQSAEAAAKVAAEVAAEKAAAAAAEVPPPINKATGKPYTPAETQAYISTVRNEAKVSREKAEAAEAAKTAAEAQLAGVLKAMGLNPDGTKYTDPDPEALQQQVAKGNESVAATQRENLVLRVSLDPTINANADALLDSRAFVTKLSALKPDDREGITALVKEAVAGTPSFKNTPPAAAASGATAHVGTQETKQRKTMFDAVKARQDRTAAAAAGQAPAQP